MKTAQLRKLRGGYFAKFYTLGWHRIDATLYWQHQSEPSPYIETTEHHSPADTIEAWLGVAFWCALAVLCGLLGYAVAT